MGPGVAASPVKVSKLSIPGILVGEFRLKTATVLGTYSDSPRMSLVCRELPDRKSESSHSERFAGNVR